MDALVRGGLGDLLAPDEAAVRAANAHDAELVDLLRARGAPAPPAAAPSLALRGLGLSFRSIGRLPGLHRGGDVEVVPPHHRRRDPEAGQLCAPAHVLLLTPCGRRATRGGHTVSVRPAPGGPAVSLLGREGLGGSGENGERERGGAGGEQCSIHRASGRRVGTGEGKRERVQGQPSNRIGQRRPRDSTEPSGAALLTRFSSSPSAGSARRTSP